MLSRVHTVAPRLPDVMMCAMFKEVRSNSAKNSISASDSSLAENPIKAWAIHTPTLNRRGRLWTPGNTDLFVKASDGGLKLTYPDVNDSVTGSN